MTNTQTTTENRFSALERSTARWRIAAVGASALLAGILLGGMDQPNNTNASDPKEVVGVTGIDGQLFRIHRDGSITYIKIKNAERTSEGLFDWGDVIIDHKYRNIDKR